MNSNNSSTREPPRIRRWLVPLLLFLSVIGFADATYLSAEHFLRRIPPCSLVAGCETVLTSSYATVFGIPVALFGALFYLLAFFLILLYRETGSRRFVTALLILSSVAFLASLLFVYLQLFVIDAICLYCLTSAVTSTLIFTGSIMLFKITNTTKDKKSG